MGWFKDWKEKRFYRKQLRDYQEEEEKQKAKLKDHTRYYYPKRTQEEEINIYKKRLIEGETTDSAEADLEIFRAKKKHLKKSI